MYDCSEDVLAFHNSEVTLPQQERTAMRDRRDANRKRLVARLEEAQEPVPSMFIKQGSYAMLTMVQDAENDYDIDDGVYFTQESLSKRDSADMPPRLIKEIVCERLKDGRFNKQPQIKKACVRVFYNEGYHVDMPIYRTRTGDGQYELANDSGWTVSRAADVEEWFDGENAKSPDTVNGRQFRRIVRCIKKVARSRKDWKDKIAPGFTITKLVSECYSPNKDREDLSLRETMNAIYVRLSLSLRVDHPVTPGASMTAGPDDPGCMFLRGKLREALSELAILDDAKCSSTQAAVAWDRVFNTRFFRDQLDSKTAMAAEAGRGLALGGSSLRPATVSSGLSFPNRPVVPNKPAGFA
jgi:hypothetical protein